MYVVGDWGLVLIVESMVHSLGASVGGFGTGDAFVVSFLCVSASILHGFLVAWCAQSLSSFAGLDASDVAMRGQWSFVYQSLSGWVSVPTFVGGFASPRGSSFVGELGALIDGVTFLSSGDGMACRHLFQPGCSTGRKQVVFDKLHKTASKDFVASPERRLTSGSVLRPSMARKTESLQGLSCNFHFFQRCSCKTRVVTTDIFM
jgi:hypothetical protein